MLAAASMPIVAGSSVHSTAVRTARPHTPRCSMLAIMEVPEREDEHAVSMLMAGPACFAAFIRSRGWNMSCQGLFDNQGAHKGYVKGMADGNSQEVPSPF